MHHACSIVNPSHPFSTSALYCDKSPPCKSNMLVPQRDLSLAMFWPGVLIKGLFTPWASGSSNGNTRGRESKRGKTQRSGSSARDASDGHRRHVWPFKVRLIRLFPCQRASHRTVTAMPDCPLMCAYNRLDPFRHTVIGRSVGSTVQSLI